LASGKITPEVFWELYSKKLSLIDDWTPYRSASSWTPIAVGVAREICEEEPFNLKTQKEYFRLVLLHN